MQRKKKKRPDPDQLSKLRAFRLTPDEDALLVSAARGAGQTVSMWIRQALVAAAAAKGRW